MSSVMLNYADANRFYHNYRHIGSMISTLHGLFAGELDVFEIELLTIAIQYHDAIYIPGSKNNEADSALAMAEELSESILARDLMEIGRLILLTKYHVTSPADKLGSIMIDLDLHELGTSMYAANSEAVKKEFLEGPYPNVRPEQFFQGRINFLQGFLARPTIFYTEIGKSLWEEEARSNMQHELDSLTG